MFNFIYRLEKAKKEKLLKYYKENHHITIPLEQTMWAYDQLEEILSQKASDKIKHDSAVKIQSSIRKFLCKRSYVRIKDKRNKAATYLQNTWKRYR